MAEPIKSAYKSSDSNLDYAIDWSKLLSTGETIVSSVWEAPVGLTISRQQVVGSVVSCFIAGGVTGEQYKVYNKITTSDDLIDERYFVIKVQDIQVSM